MDRRVRNLTFLALLGSGLGMAQASTWTGTTIADAFVTMGSAGTLSGKNYGAAGTLVVAAASQGKGDTESLLKFDLSSAKTQFDTLYGVGAWQITNITLTLASNVGTQGANPGNAIFPTINAGDFAISWLADDSWVEGTGTPNMASGTGVNYNSLSTLETSGTEQLGTYTYTPPGNNAPLTWTLNLTSGFSGDAASGGNLSLLAYATADSTVSYLFNAHTFVGNQPILTIVAVPEPRAMSLLLGAATVTALGWRRARRRAA